jgi:hypothetical protein
MKIIEIEQGSDQWHEERACCVTGTRIQAAIGAKYSAAKKKWTLGDKKVQYTLLCELVSEMQSELEISDFQNDAMMRGTELEPYSVDAASKTLGVKFDVCGMLQSDTLQHFKFSPDAVCYENGVIVGGYETKSKQGKKHIEYILADEVPPEHLWQCLCPMIMDDCVKWWAFGHFDDRNNVNDLFLKIIRRTDYPELIAKARLILVDFLNEVESVNSKIKGKI